MEYSDFASREKEKADLFESVYEIEQSIIDPRGGERHIVDDGLLKCRYCRRGEEEGAQFSKTAHLVPEMLGNRTIISGAECDDCNERFSKYEFHLKHFLGPSRVLVGVEGKKKEGRRVRPFDDSLTESKIVHDPGHIRLDLDMGENEVDVRDTAKRVEFTAFLRPYKPIYVWLALSRIVMGLVDRSELEKLSWLRYLASPDVTDNHLSRVPEPICQLNWFSIPGAGVLFDPIEVRLYGKRRAEFDSGWLPEKTLVLKFGRFIFQVFGFSDDDLDHMNGRGFRFAPYPILYGESDFDAYGDFELSKHALGGLETAKQSRRIVIGWNGDRRDLTEDELSELGIESLRERE